MIEGFLMGFVAAASLTAGLYFLKFWKKTRDAFFLSFVIFFFTEAAIRVAALLMLKPNEGSPWIYLIRLLALLLILGSILRKNYGNR